MFFRSKHIKPLTRIFNTKNEQIGLNTQGPHSHILMTVGGGPSDFFGSEILAQSDFLGSMKDAGNFLGCKEKQTDFFGLRKKD